MSDRLRQKIYNYIDKNGIPGNHFGLISLNSDFTSSLKSERIFKPDLSKFDLSEDASEQVVIDYIFHTTNIKVSTSSELMHMKCIDGKPFFLILNEHEREKIRYCLAFGRIPGSVIFRNDGIESLGNIKEINGDLGFSESIIKDLGNLKKVKGSIWIAQEANFFTQLKSLQNLEFVGGDLSIKNSPITSLGNLKYVGGNLNLRQTFVEDLGIVEFIGGNLLLSKDMKHIINSSKTEIRGSVRYYNDRNIDSIL